MSAMGNSGSNADVRVITRLRDEYGPDIVLFNEKEETVSYRILREVAMGGAEYAIVQSAAQRKQDEFEVLRIVAGGGKPEVETVEDDAEWERVAEWYDDSLFPDPAEE